MFGIELNLLGLFVIIISAIGSVAVMRHVLGQHSIRFGELETKFTEDRARLDRHGDDLVRLNTKAESTMTSDMAQTKFVSKELFKQHEKNVEQHFGILESMLKEVLENTRK